MNGRQENALKIEEFIEQKLENAPRILIDYSYSFAGKTEQTKRMYIFNVAKYLHYLEKELKLNTSDIRTYQNMKTSDINKYLEFIRYKNVKGKRIEKRAITRATQFYAVSNFYEFLISEGIIEKNPCERASVPKDNEEKDIVYMTPDEIETVKSNIMEAAEENKDGKRGKWWPRDLAIVTLGCRTGMRVTAITEINLSDINFKDNTIRVIEKGNVAKPIYLDDDTADLLRHWIEVRRDILGRAPETDALFISERGTRVCTGTIRYQLSKYTEDLDKHITPHKMRSSCATNLYEATNDIYLVQQLLGHKNIANTRRYAKVGKERRYNAAKIMSAIC